MARWVGVHVELIGDFSEAPRPPPHELSKHFREPHQKSINSVRYRTCRDIDDSFDPMVHKRIEIMPSFCSLTVGKEQRFSVQPGTALIDTPRTEGSSFKATEKKKLELAIGCQLLGQ